jgi:hypothetical protein
MQWVADEIPGGKAETIRANGDEIRSVTWEPIPEEADRTQHPDLRCSIIDSVIDWRRCSEAWAAPITTQETPPESINEPMGQHAAVAAAAPVHRES